MITSATIDKVRDISIVDVVSKFVDLKKAGSSYRACSPFKDEKTPSFYVVPARQMFKCFSSGKGGSGITFVMEHEGISYIDAVKYLCKEFGIPVDYESKGQHNAAHYTEIEILYKVNHAVARLYAQNILNIGGDHPAFRELIDRRRFSADTLLQWQIGYAPGETESYAPSKWNFLSKTMVSTGYYQQGIDLGLIKTKDQVNYDVFRNRIIFPVLDHQEHYVAFGARSLKPDNFNAKYLNSSESKIFNKSNVLFGLNFAGHAIRKKGYALLMEGYTDVISFHQAGHINTVGTCGTSLTDGQVKLLKNYTNKVLLIYDPDEAGQSAAARSIPLLARAGFQVNILPMPSIVEMKREKGASVWREPVFITHRSKESISVKSDNGPIDIPTSKIEAIDKIDPDEIVRIFN